ncbi:hypothetical protein GI374_15860 [Paracoccus sp. S-4012]|uniref:hypothetical protein n=1 Tax=Paracoccus sp. S-4012 TaxID=2665648 RepID=UPI0012B0495D|nr:hypothetical protein [Paracoccus sp. S-4012]MRX51868.1 hypothetical protein [Paracoccus sp. S-4012]
MLDSENEDETDLLPADWLTEGVAEAGCRDVDDGTQLSLRAAPGMKYFGVRLAASRVAPMFSLARVSFDYRIVSRTGIAGLHVVLREWRQAGSFNFQSQKVLPLIPAMARAELSLSVREPGMVVEPVLLFEAAAREDLSAATILIEDLCFEVT